MIETAIKRGGNNAILHDYHEAENAETRDVTIGESKICNKKGRFDIR